MPRRLLTRATAVPAAAVLVFAPALLVSSPASAVDFPDVDTEVELNDAITDANATPDLDRILISGDFALSAATTLITEDLEVVGGGHTITGTGFTALDADGAALTVTDLTILAPYTGVEVQNGSLVADNVTVEDADGSGFESDNSDVLITNSTVLRSDGENGELFGNAGDSIIVRASEFSESPDDGGLEVILDGDATVELTDVIADDNETYGVGVTLRDDSSGTLDGVHARSQDTDNGLDLELSDQATISVVDSDGSENAVHGGRIVVTGTASATIEGSGPTNNVGAGWLVQAIGAGTSTTLTGVLSSLNGSGMAFLVAGGASVTASDSRIQGGNVGIDFPAPEAGDPAGDGAVTLTRLEILSPDTHGLVTRPAAGAIDISLLESEISGVDSGASDGAAIQAGLENATLTVERSSIFDNRSAEPAGGILVYGNAGGAFRLINSTLTGNGSSTFATAIRAGSVGVVELLNSTIVDNPSIAPAVAETSVLIEGVGSTTIRNTVIDGAGAAPLAVNGAGTLAVDYSLIGGGNAQAAAAVSAGIGNVSGSPDPMLGTLADNGGPTLTMLPQLGSPLLDAGDPAFAAPPAIDQRGQPRVSGGRIDIGAVEVQPTDRQTIPATGASTGWLLPLAVGLLVLGLAGVGARSARIARTG